MMNDGVNDEIEDSRNHFRSKMGLEYNSQTTKWFWHSGTVMTTVMMMNDDVDDEIEVSSGDDDERW